MKIEVHDDAANMGRAAAGAGARSIREAIAARGEANIVVATGASQFEVLGALIEEPDIAWHRVHGFHLDEYVGLPITHGASFRKYLWERFVSRLPVPLASFWFIDGESDPSAECRRIGEALREHPTDVAFIGIGENGHIAFNDPPADFDTDDPYLVVELDEACRRQQFGEGWFPSFESVPKRAISMSVRQILASAVIQCSVPDERKSEAVRDAVEGEVTPQVPASILQTHAACTLQLDRAAASRLRDA